jgi:hypothetical protein
VLAPIQPAAVGVIVKVVVCDVAVVLRSVPAIVEPVPLAAMPVRLEVLLRVQVNVVPATELGFVMPIGVMAMPEQKV